MLQGVFHRATVAILLIGSLVAPAQICLQHAQMTGHACCASMPESSSTVQSNCCAVRPTLPADVVAPALPAPQALSAVQEFVSSKELSSLNEPTVSDVVPPQSPPTGASILRI
jgi:hypothetical protein